jgi:hypothetical protein
MDYEEQTPKEEEYAPYGMSRKQVNEIIIGLSIRQLKEIFEETNKSDLEKNLQSAIH